ncbi:MAG: ATP-dependent RecD-like DNA helicase [Bacteroidales bacterium]
MLQQEPWADYIIESLPFTPNNEQESFAYLFEEFMTSHKQIFVLKGYAGTGKTSIISAIVKSSKMLKRKTFLMAPTGRAAKVLANYSNQKAFTIHKTIYKLQTNITGISSISLSKNKSQNTLFIIDEASMIPEYNMETNLFGDRNLLADLFHYVNQGKNCKILFVGDTAQLPPVGINLSPALDLQGLEYNFNVPVMSFELKSVMRQALESGILWNATKIREKIENDYYDPPYFFTQNYHDFEKSPGGWELQEELSTALNYNGTDQAIIICRSNKRANIYNREIRNRILMREEEIEGGDMLMVVKNNYYWLPETEGSGFIANGDLIEVLRVRKTEEIYGFRFADINIRLSDSDYEKELDVKIILNSIEIEASSLPWSDQEKLWNNIMIDYQHLSTKRKQVEAVKNDPYYNALQIKYAYALTCHKTQGGQWPQVFIDQGYITDEMIDAEYLRWLYTAITRAQEKVSLVGFRNDFFHNEEYE